MGLPSAKLAGALMRLLKNRLVIAIVSAVLGAVGWLVAENLIPERKDLGKPLPHHLAAGDPQFGRSMAALFGCQRCLRRILPPYQKHVRVMRQHNGIVGNEREHLLCVPMIRPRGPCLL